MTYLFFHGILPSTAPSHKKSCLIIHTHCKHMNTNTEKNTPLMQQYFDIKQKFQDTLLFFQVGDFYELFFDDAKIASSFLAITLTKRGKNKGEDVPLCGVPVHALDHYVTKLIKGGFKVALCDQITKPQPGTMVQRAVTRVFTPATLTEATLLDDKSASYLLTFYPYEQQWGVVFAELLTAQIFATSLPAENYRMMESELIRFFPDEIVLPQLKKMSPFEQYFKKMGYCTSLIQTPDLIDDSSPLPSSVWIENQFNNQLVQKIQTQPVFEKTLGLLYHYLKKNQEKSLDQFKSIQFYAPEDYLILDAATQRNLEIVKNSQDGGRKNTLFAVLDQAKTAMGSRAIKKWISRPLIQKTTILQRQEVVGMLCAQPSIMQSCAEALCQVADIERIIGRIGLNRAVLHDYLALKNSLALVPTIKTLVLNLQTTQLIDSLTSKLSDFGQLIELLECSLNDNSEDKIIIKKGFHQELDRLRCLIYNGQEEMLKLEQQEIARTGIASLKIGYTNQSGYYIEVTNPNLEKVPTDFIHQQTMVNRKRFVTQELKALEADIFKATHDIERIEQEIFEQIKREVEAYLPQLRLLAQSLAYLDGLLGFALVAHNNRYTRPHLNDQNDIIIRQGRHPVVEEKLGHQFIPNSTDLTNSNSLWIITGPNMGGKSTYLRQVALMCIMAQCGSFVPADEASLPILDRVFTRIGSGDNVAEGKSTFLVEMEETAAICTQATTHSLVILDEVGRGTSTFDGIALAQAIIEYIFTSIKAKCLFATHYQELTDLAKLHPGISNYHMACHQTTDRLLFLHKIVPGIAPGSFGLEVAKLAQLPYTIVKRAQVILQDLHSNHTPTASNQRLLMNNAQNAEQEQAMIIDSQRTSHKAVTDLIKNTDFDNLSPRQAFDLLWSLKNQLIEK